MRRDGGRRPAIMMIAQATASVPGGIMIAGMITVMSAGITAMPSPGAKGVAKANGSAMCA